MARFGLVLTKYALRRGFAFSNYHLLRGRRNRSGVSIVESLKPSRSHEISDQIIRSYSTIRAPVASHQIWNFEVIGSAGLLIRAKRRGIIPENAPLLIELQEAGLYLSNSLFRQLLSVAGEDS